MSIIDVLTGPWAIAPDKLLEIQSIYAAHLRGERTDLAALEARLGKPLANEQQKYRIEQGGVAVLSLSGVMAPKANLFSAISGGMSTQMAAVQLESAAIDERVKAIVLHLDSPGGQVTGTPEFADTIYSIALQKPLVTFSDGLLCSAAYWAGAAGNAIYISSNVVQVGSIGVIHSRSYNPNSTAAEDTVVAGKYKRLASNNEPYSAESRAIVQADVDYVYSLFVDTVARYRGTNSEQVLQHMADGRVFRGQQALDAGLVDAVCTLDALIDQLASNPSAAAQRRRAVFSSTAAPTAPIPKPKPSKPQKEHAMSITRANLEQEHPDLFAQVRAEFSALGASQERERIQAVLAVGDGLPGHEALLQGLAFDGKTDGAKAALAVLAAEKQTRAAAIAAHRSDAPPAAKPSAAPPDTAAKSKQEQTDEAKALAKSKGIDFMAALKELGYA